MKPLRITRLIKTRTNAGKWITANAFLDSGLRGNIDPKKLAEFETDPPPQWQEPFPRGKSKARNKTYY